MKFNYVILDSNGIYNKVMFHDVLNLDNVNYIPLDLYAGVPKLLRPLVKIHISAKLNHYIKIPFKFYWLKRLLSGIQFNDNKPICFILTRAWLEMGYNIGLLDYLKQHYSNAQFVLYLIDLFRTYRTMYYSNIKSFTLDAFRKDFDLIISYDKDESRNYGFSYYPDTYSRFEIQAKGRHFSEIDVFFCGRAKDRLSFILNIAEELNAHGFKIHFCIAGVSLDSRQSIPGVYYINMLMSYWDYLLCVQQSKCILEIMQNGASGYTLRAIEAICYNKMLLTNNRNISSIKFYHSDYISIIDQSEESIIDLSFFQKIKNNTNVDYHYDGSFSPIYLLKYIESVLQ